MVVGIQMNRRLEECERLPRRTGWQLTRPQHVRRRKQLLSGESDSWSPLASGKSCTVDSFVCVAGCHPARLAHPVRVDFFEHA